MHIDFNKDKLQYFLNGEWCFALNPAGSYALNNLLNIPSRRYHTLCAFSMTPPVNRFSLLHSIDESICIDGRFYNLYSRRLSEKEIFPKGHEYLQHININPESITHSWKINRVILRRTVQKGENGCILHISYQIKNPDKHDISFFIRPFFENREASSLETNKPEIHFSGDHILAGEFSMRPTEECNLIKGEERKRIYLHKEAEYCMEKFFLDVYSPSYYRLDSSHNIKLDIDFCFDGDLNEQSAIPRRECSDKHMNYLSGFSRNFIVSDKENTYIMAGYPWFGPWGRDTFISLPGLLIYHKDFKIAENIIDSYCRLIKEGIIPNMITDSSDILYNTADASLWLINSIYLLYIMTGERRIADKYYSLINNIIFKYRVGTFNDIFMDKSDFLISAGSARTQLTWMDASRDGVIFTPRYGKTVEINALWYNSVCIFQYFSELIGENSNSLSLFRLSEKIRSNFMYRFWNDEKKYLNDYIATDSSINSQLRPNQLYALSLPFPVVNDMDVADAILKQCEKLLTPNGIRTLSPDHSDYKGEYCGNWFERDSAYHQGTAWSFLYPVYIEALLKRHRDDKTMKEEIRKKLEDYIHKNIYRSCVGYLPEIWNGSAPYIPHGTPAQAWSTAEMLRVWFMYFENN